MTLTPGVDASGGHKANPFRAIRNTECLPETAIEGTWVIFHHRSRQGYLDVGVPADLVLLTRPWSEARNRLDSEDVRMTWCHGEATFEREKLNDAE